MNITHVIRGDDHLSNTPKQVLLYKALGWKIPEFAHLPMILDEEKKKLSKRRNTVSVEEYRKLGYLPEALFNFLTLLGFAPPDNREIISVEELVQLFTFERVNKKSSVFDMDKLNWINVQYIKTADESEIAGLIREKLPSYFDELPAGITDEYIKSLIPLMKERSVTVNDFIEKGKYFFKDPESYDEKGLAKHWNENAKELLKEYLEIIKNTLPKEFTSSNLETQLRRFAEQKSLKPAAIIHPLRLALTGGTASPGIFELMEVLGKDTVLRRIEKLIRLQLR
jgi:glutamyl-tRNA synthetase